MATLPSESKGRTQDNKNRRRDGISSKISWEGPEEKVELESQELRGLERTVSVFSDYNELISWLRQ